MKRKGENEGKGKEMWWILQTTFDPFNLERKRGEGKEKEKEGIPLFSSFIELGNTT